MLYKFKSKVTGDLIMLEPNGQQVLEIIGKDAGPKGIILPAAMPAAIAALEAAMAADDASAQAADEETDVEAKSRAISLRQRAVPFLEMLRRCSAAGEEIVWGV